MRAQESPGLSRPWPAPSDVGTDATVPQQAAQGPSIPDDLMLAAMKGAYEALKEDHQEPPDLWAALVHHGVAAVLPLHERQVRSRIAAELRAVTFPCSNHGGALAGFDSRCVACQRHAALVGAERIIAGRESPNAKAVREMRQEHMPQHRRSLTMPAEVNVRYDDAEWPVALKGMTTVKEILLYSLINHGLPTTAYENFALFDSAGTPVFDPSGNAIFAGVKPGDVLTLKYTPSREIVIGAGSPETSALTHCPTCGAPEWHEDGRQGWNPVDVECEDCASADDDE